MTPADREIRALGADIDVRALMEELRGEIRRKQEAGEYPPDVLLELELQGDDREQADDVLTAALAELKRSANFTSQVTIGSKRPLIGPLVSRARQLIRASLSWYFNGILGQLKRFSDNVQRSIAIVAEQTTRTSGRLTTLEKQVEDLDRWANAMDERQVEERLVRLERTLEELRDKLHQGRS